MTAAVIAVPYVTERESDFKLTTDTSHLALSGELGAVSFGNFEDWPRYSGTALYIYIYIERERQRERGDVYVYM